MSTTQEVAAMQDNTYQDILSALKEALSYLPPDTKYEICDVRKNNDTVQTAIIIKEPGSNISPTIYLDAFKKNIEQGRMSIQKAVENIANLYKVSAIRNAVDTKSLMNKEDLFCEVINRDMNRAFLEDVPHEVIEDVAVIVRCRVTDEASFIVKNESLGGFGLTPSEALDIAKRNTIESGMTVRTMNEVLSGMLGESELLYDAIPMIYVVSNHNNRYGATMPFISEEARQGIFDKVGGDYYLIPSSIHECLAIPVGNSDPNDVRNIIGDVNATQVRAEEVLGTQPYLVDSSLKLKLACEQPKLSQMLEQSIKQSHGMHL